MQQFKRALVSNASTMQRRYPNRDEREDIICRFAAEGRTAGYIQARLLEVGFSGADLNFGPINQIRKTLDDMRLAELEGNVVDTR